ncbi:MAG: arsenic resistance N-acetyltransferase ArsN2 [Bacteroidetes bacterium]|nr:arsenic resistance N-acetyltransferase ArsN2 [Bacteroidota bacterium]
MQHQFSVHAVTPAGEEAISRLLQENKLPVADIASSSIQFWIAKKDTTPAGVIGLEQSGGYGLLRSMATATAFRNQGVAAFLVHTLEAYAKEQKLKDIYLLTETAEQYFNKKGYHKISRDQAPAAIQSSAEFSHLCPSTAILMKKSLTQPKKLLFVCVENSNRSQMSQAFASIVGGDAVEAYSAGSKPSGIVNPKAIAAMKELGYDLSTHDSKSLQEVEQYAPFDAVVTMGCGDACPWMPAKQFIDWQIPDPRNMNEEEFRKVRDLIKEKVTALIAKL